MKPFYVVVAALMLCLTMLNISSAADIADSVTSDNDAFFDQTLSKKGVDVATQCENSARPVRCTDEVARNSLMFTRLGAQLARHHFAYRIINEAVQLPGLSWTTKAQNGAAVYMVGSKVMFSVTDGIPSKISGTRFLPKVAKADAFLQWCAETLWRTTYEGKRNSIGPRAYAVGVAQAMAVLVADGRTADLEDLLLVFAEETKQGGFTAFRINREDQAYDIETVVFNKLSGQYEPVERHVKKYYQ